MVLPRDDRRAPAPSGQPAPTPDTVGGITPIGEGVIPPDYSRTSFTWTPATSVVFDYDSVGSYLSPNRVAEDFQGDAAKYWLLNLKQINPPRYQSILQGLLYSGYLGKSVKNPLALTDQQIQGGYEDFLGYTQAQQALARSSGRQVPSFTELLSMTAMQGAATREGTRGAGGGPFRSETTSVTEYDADNVASIANSAYQNKLGRKASKKEREALAEILNQEQRRNPMVTISAGTTAGGTMAGTDGQRTARGTVSTTTTRGGIQPTEFAEEQAVQAEDFEERFFVSTFTDMLKDLAKPAV